MNIKSIFFINLSLSSSKNFQHIIAFLFSINLELIYNIVYFLKDKQVYTMKTSQKIRQSKTKNKSGSYNLINGSKKQISPFCALYQAMNRQTKQIWHAKVINNQLIKQYQIQEPLSFNQTVLMECKQMENIVYVEQIFLKGGSTFIIQEQYTQTLVDRVNQQCPVFASTIEDVLSDVISGLLQIYKQKFSTRNLRPQHIICVDDVWKIQSFVYNSELYGIQSEFCWSPKYASPQDRGKDSQLSQRQVDEQIVWNIGILGLYMILGPKFQYQKITKDTFIPWNTVKEKTSDSIYRFLIKALKVDFKERMRLRQLLESQLFSNLNNGQMSPFLSYSKYFGDQSDKSFKSNVKSIALSSQDENKLEILKNDVERFKYFAQVQRYVQQLPYKNSSDIHLIRYLCFKISYDNLFHIKNQLTSWKRESAPIRSNSQIKQIQQDLNIFINTVKGYKLNYSKNLRGFQLAKSQVVEIRSCLYQQIIDQKLPYTEVVILFKKIAGSIYTILSKECQFKKNQSKQRTVCFYSLAAYLLHFYDIQKFGEVKFYEKNGALSLTRLINEAPLSLLIQITQKLIKEHFAIQLQY